MAKRITALLVCALLLLTMIMPAYASFSERGDYTNIGRYSFCFDTDEALLIYNDDGFSYPHDDIWVGSKLYIPIYCDFDGDIATMAQISEMKAGVVYKANRFVTDVRIVDGAAVNPAELDSGAYACISFTEDYIDIVGTGFICSLVITIDGVAQQISRISFNDTLKNYVEDLHHGSVYTAQKPTVFRTDRFEGEAVFDFGGGVRYTTHVAKDSRYYLNLDRSKIDALEEKYKKVYTEVYDFRGEHDTFARTGTLQIPINLDSFKPKKNAKTQVYVYKYSGGMLYSVNPEALSFNSNTKTLTINTATLETYVLSAQALLPELDEDDDDIIKTDFARDDTKEPAIKEPEMQAPPQSPGYSDADNPTSGGGSILTANPSAQNPSTSDDSSPLLALFGLAAALVVGSYTKGRGGRGH